MRYLRWFVVLMVAMAVMAIGVSVIAQEKPPAEIVIKEAAFGTFKKSPVKFAHEGHFKVRNIACTECHHNYVKGKNVWKKGDPVKRCSECHKVAAAEKNSLTYCIKTYPKGKAPGLKCAFHKNCAGCHKDLKKKDPTKYAKIPTTCSKCHPRKK